MYNGLDIAKGHHFIKVSCSSYLAKIISGHNWLTPKKTSATKTPLLHDTSFISNLETDCGPVTPQGKLKLEKSMNFKYRQAIGEILFAAVTCRPDILFTVIKLSQYSTRSDKIHYQAVKHMFKYLCDNLLDGLHYWHKSLNTQLPDLSFPTVRYDTHKVDLPPFSPRDHYGFVDAKWGGDTSHRKSVSGISLFLAGAHISYRSRFQPTILLSSTERDFIATSEAVKTTLYIRSILDNICLPQDSATPLHEDNAAAIAMAHSSKPTYHIFHIEIRHFALLDWI